MQLVPCFIYRCCLEYPQQPTTREEHEGPWWSEARDEDEDEDEDEDC